MTVAVQIAPDLLFKSEARQIRAAADPARSAATSCSSTGENAAKLAMAEWCLKTSRLGNRLLHEGAMGDPQFYILFSAFIGELRQNPPIIKGIALENGISHSTVMRWVNVLVQRALIHRRSDPIDLRRTCIELTPDGRRIVTDFLDMLLACKVQSGL